METSRLEKLLEELVEQNATVISRLEDILAAVNEMNGELSWIKKHSFAERVVDQLDQIESAIGNIGT